MNAIQKLGVAGVVAAAVLAVSGGTADALSIRGNNITLRMGSGHPVFIQYVTQMTKFFAPTVKARVEKETKYKIKFLESYNGKIVNVFDTLEGVQDGRLDIGGWCVCFDDDKAMALNLAYYVPFAHPDGNVTIKIFRKLITKFPEMIKDLEGRYNQKLLGMTGFNNYGLMSAFDWNSFADLKGHKILAAGPNLPWVKGGIPVRTTIPKIAQQLSTGVGEAIVLFPDTNFKLKLHEAMRGKAIYTITDFGAVVQISLTMNLNTRKKLPPEVVKIIDEVGIEYERVATAAGMADHQWGLDKLAGVGVKIKKITPAAKKDWAQELATWPNERAQAVKAKKGIDMPKIMREYIRLTKEAGHIFPVDYKIN